MSMEINESPKMPEVNQTGDNKPQNGANKTQVDQISDSVWEFEQPAMQNIVTLMNTGVHGKEVQEFSNEMRTCCDEYREVSASHGKDELNNDAGLLDKLKAAADKAINGLKQLINKEREVLQANGLTEFKNNQQQQE